MKGISKPLVLLLLCINIILVTVCTKIAVFATVKSLSSDQIIEAERCRMSDISILSDNIKMQEDTFDNSNLLDESCMIELFNGSKTETVSLSDYLIGVVCSEMPYTFELEALKAQAVAARTYTLRLLETNERHAEGTVCTDPNHCSGYIDYDEYAALYGNIAADRAFEKVGKAVHDTDGEVLTYNDVLCCTVYHSSSDGNTENSYNLWNTYTPYLISVSSPEDAVCESVSVSYDRAERLLEGKSGFSANKSDVSIGHNDSGRCESVKIMGVTLTAGQARSLFGLKSCDFNISVEANGYLFTVRGYGHGIGMSQYGADTFAKSGYSHKEILLHYYSGTVLENLNAIK